MLCTARGVKGGKRGFCFAAPEGEGVKGGLCFAAPGVVLCSTRGSRGGTAMGGFNVRVQSTLLPRKQG